MNKIFMMLILILSARLTFGQQHKVTQTATSQPFVLGVIDEIQSTSLAEKRILNIYLPEGYQQKDRTQYPVIYLLDGSADEDFIHIVGLVQFNSFEWIKQVPKSIVVGIASVDRRRDFTFPTTIAEDKKTFPTSGHSDKFISFIEKELQPFIANKYHSNSHKTIIGQSLGGLLATEILIKKPSLFDTYIIISPSLWWDNGSLFNQYLGISDQQFNQSTSVYIGVGKEGLAPGKNLRMMEVDANLLAEQLKAIKNKAIKVFFDYLPQENHATIMHQAVSNSFKLLYLISTKE